MKILMLCLGNICRSPLAQGLLESKLPAKLFEIDSAGLIDYHQGKPPYTDSIKIAKIKGLDISNQKSRPIVKKDFEYFDCIYAMDTAVQKEALNKCPKEYQHKIKLILSETNTQQIDVKDPYYCDFEEFENMYHVLDEVTTKIAEKLNENK